MWGKLFTVIDIFCRIMVVNRRSFLAEVRSQKSELGLAGIGVLGALLEDVWVSSLGRGLVQESCRFGECDYGFGMQCRKDQSRR